MTALVRPRFHRPAAACLCAAGLLAAACGRPVAPGGAHSAAAAVPPSSASPAAPPPPVAKTASSTASPEAWPAVPFQVTATVPMTIQTTAPPEPVTLPPDIQDGVFATAADGWVVTSGMPGTQQAGTSAVYRTTDGGATWQAVWHGHGLALGRIGILRPPGRAGTGPASVQLFAAGFRVSGLRGIGPPVWLTSSDGGTTWSSATPALPAGLTAQRLGFLPGWATAQAWAVLDFDFPSASVGYAEADPEYTLGGGGPLLKTTDGGRVWRAVALPKGLALAGGLDFLTPSSGWITGSAKGTCSQVWHTADGGATWQPLPGACPAVPLQAVYFTDAEHGWAAGGVIPFVSAHTVILRTADGGRQWQTVYSTRGPASDGPATHLRFTSPSEGWAWGGTCKMGQNEPCAGPVLFTDNGGATWRQTQGRAAGLVGAGLQALTTSPTGGAAWSTADGGRTWTQRTPAASDNPCCLSAAAGTAWIGTLQTSDGGATWTRAVPVPGGSSGGPLWRASSSEIFNMGVSGGVDTLQVSRDGGATWTASPLPAADLGVSDVSFANPADGWAVTQMPGCPDVGCAAVDRTTDGGATWQTVATLAMNGVEADLAFGSGAGAVLGDGAHGPEVAVTTDGGVHWVLSPVPSGMTCTGVDAAGAAVWLTCRTAAGEGLLLRSTDGGRIWRGQTAAAVPLTLVMIGARRGLMLASGVGATTRGLFRTTDGGATWTEIWPSPPPTATPAAVGTNTRQIGATPTSAG